MALSYQHEYHAGNHADLLKHTCLCAILTSLAAKDKPFTVIDTHASAGLFNLNDGRLLKTGEAAAGIQKVFALLQDGNRQVMDSMPEAVRDYIQAETPYLEQGKYAGSPELERLFARKGDHIHLTEKHPQAYASLLDNCSRPSEAKLSIYQEDAYKKLRALVPPQVKRGLILIDPSYEDESDWQQVRQAVEEAHRKWNTAVIALWYPLLQRRRNLNAQLLSGLENFVKMQLLPKETVRIELALHDPQSLPPELQSEQGSHLYGSGMFIINPPWQLSTKMQQAVEWYRRVLA